MPHWEAVMLSLQVPNGVLRRATVLLLGAAAITLAPAGPSAHADTTTQITCQQQILYRVNFTSGTAHGDSEYSNCVSATHPEIDHGSAIADGTATGTPDNVTITETLHMVWKDAAGGTLFTSTAHLTRRFIGPENAMVQQGDGVVIEGLFTGATISEANAVAGTAQRETNPDGSVTYRYPDGYKGVSTWDCCIG
jgi:hypothetical protein